MSIKQRIIIISILLSAIPTGLVGLFAHFQISSASVAQIEQLAEDKAMALSKTKKQTLERYLEQIRNHIITMASNQTVTKAMKDFSSAFVLETASGNMRSKVENYYKDQFGKKYTELTKENFQLSKLTDNISDVALYWQTQYLADNPNPLGQKDDLIQADDGSLYSDYHKAYHQQFDILTDSFGYYDVFLVDINSSHVVYSVFKETDYATSLNQGPYRDSGLAKAFRGGAKLNNGEVHFENFAPYLPSYEGMASFISSPVYFAGRKIGVLIFQMPIGEFNTVMTYSGEWEASGLGQRGESYLTTENGSTLSEVRLFAEKPQEYIQNQTAQGVDGSVLNSISAKGSSIGLHKINSQLVSKAFGATGVDKATNYQGRPVVFGHEVVNFLDARWALITELDEEELFEDYRAMMTRLDWSIAIAAIVLATLGGVIGGVYSNQIVRPIKDATTNMLAIAQGDGDLTKRLPTDGAQETAVLSKAFNGFAEKVQKTVASLLEHTGQLDQAMVSLKETSQRSLTLVDQQNDQSEMISTAVTEMAASIQEVANNAESVATASGKSSKDADVARGIFETTLTEIGGNSEKIQEASRVINQLEEETKSIGSVLDVIRGIAEQTNLLALNAAIEAARAGEQGRGFAVVADEVRTLASRTQTSTQEIEEMISKLQTGAANAVSVMAESQKSAESSIEKGHQASDAITSTASAANQISEMMIQVATATEEQSTVAEDINMNVVSISGLSRDVAEEFSKINAAVNNLFDLSKALKSSAGQFKV